MTVLLLLAALVPQQVLITTPRGRVTIPVMNEQGAAAVAAVLLAQPLGLTVSLDGSSAHVTLGDRSFDFDIGSPFVRYEGAAYPLVGAPPVAPPAPPAPPAPLPPAVIAAPNAITGLRLVHTIVVDPGHGGVDPGNPGLHFPHGLTEKDITLGIGKLLRAELIRRGLNVVLTRATDTLIDLANRPLFCRADCDLFVSIHVNAMPAGRRQTQVNGVETYFVSDAKTEDQKRVAQMENAALRFETAPGLDGGGSLGFILHDLQLNEYLRESARLAELVQGKVAGIHPGENRGVQQGPFLVLAAARRPAILVEAGFATNPGDGAFLASSQGQHKIATAIADGIVAYLLEFERRLAVGTGGGQAR